MIALTLSLIAYMLVALVVMNYEPKEAVHADKTELMTGQDIIKALSMATREQRYSNSLMWPDNAFLN